MIKSKAYEYFITQDHNCAETALLAIRDAYGLDIGPEEMKLVSAFGGGMGCGKLWEFSREAWLRSAGWP